MKISEWFRVPHSQHGSIKIEPYGPCRDGHPQRFVIDWKGYPFPVGGFWQMLSWVSTEYRSTLWVVVNETEWDRIEEEMMYGDSTGPTTGRKRRYDDVPVLDFLKTVAKCFPHGYHEDIQSNSVIIPVKEPLIVDVADCAFVFLPSFGHDTTHAEQWVTDILDIERVPVVKQALVTGVRPE